jgi:hypothetical protein
MIRLRSLSAAALSRLAVTTASNAAGFLSDSTAGSGHRFLALRQSVSEADICYGALLWPGGHHLDEAVVSWVKAALAGLGWQRERAQAHTYGDGQPPSLRPSATSDNEFAAVEILGPRASTDLSIVRAQNFNH